MVGAAFDGLLSSRLASTALIAAFAVLGLTRPSLASETETVLHVRLDNQAITPVTARFISRAIREAESMAASHLVIELDTPGGVVDATRQIVRDILASRTKVVVFVSPAGARAASAGLFITLASHVAVMAPGTHIGAAHPVRIGGLPGGPTQPKPEGKDVMGEKILNDTQAWARTLAELRGRNVEFAELAVVESKSFTATEAEAKGLVDFLATDLDMLLERLEAKGAIVRTLEMGWGQRLLAALASPNLAFILLLVGFYGLIFEFYTAGFGVAGVLGAVCILLAFVGLAVLPMNYAGLALLAVGLGLFVAEAFITSFGLLSAGGALCVILGGLMLVDSPPGFARVSASVAVPAALATAAVALFVLGGVVKAHRASVKTGSEALCGELAIAQEDFCPADEHYSGTVLVHGEYWNAVSTSPIAADAPVSIHARDGLVLTVKPNPPTQGATP